MATIVAVIDDLLFQSRLEQQAQRLGYGFVVVDEVTRLDGAISSGVTLAIVDLHVQGIDWRAAVAKVQERGVPVLAFGRHSEAQLLRDARAAGCDRVVPRSQLVEELSALLGEVAPNRHL